MPSARPTAATPRLAPRMCPARRSSQRGGGHLGDASPPYLLATIGWFLLCSLGQAVDLHEAWGLALPEMAFGGGCAFCSIALSSIVQNLHHSHSNRNI